MSITDEKNTTGFQTICRRAWSVMLLAALSGGCVGHSDSELFPVTPRDESHEIIVRPEVTDDQLLNPGIGFQSFYTVDDSEQVAEGRYPPNTLAYVRYYWSELEPQEGLFDFSPVDAFLDQAKQHGKTVALGLMPHDFLGTEPGLPGWFAEKTGGERWQRDGYWATDYNSDEYIKDYGALVKAFAELYDGNPQIAFVDVRIVGAWGEGLGSGDLTQQTRESLVRAYTDHFRRTQLVMMLTDAKTNGFGLSQANVGFRADSLGDMPPAGLTGDDRAYYWSHMTDYYPRKIIECGLSEAWKTAPVTFEISSDFDYWLENGFDLGYIIEQSQKWHVSSVNGKSSDIPEEYRELVKSWLKRMGYRFALRKFTCRNIVSPGGELSFTTWWENLGCAPCYAAYPLALRLVREDDGDEAKGNPVILKTDADITRWLPGDVLYDGSVTVPAGVPSGTYRLQIGILGMDGAEPAVNLAITGRTPDGWYDLTVIEITE